MVTFLYVPQVKLHSEAHTQLAHDGAGAVVVAFYFSCCSFQASTTSLDLSDQQGEYHIKWNAIQYNNTSCMRSEKRRIAQTPSEIVTTQAN